MPSPENTLDKAEKDTVHTKSVEHEQPQSTDSTSAFEVTTTEVLTEEEDELEAGDGYADSAFGTDDSDTTSITSSIYKGHVENGRRYQTKREGEWWVPADEKQFLSFGAARIVYLLSIMAERIPYFEALFQIPYKTSWISALAAGSEPRK